MGNHPGHGRLVFDWPAPPQYRMEQAGASVLLSFPQGAAIDLSGARRPPRNMAAVTADGESIRITLKPGVRPRVFRVGPKLVVDALNPGGEAIAEAAPLPARVVPVPQAAAEVAPQPVPSVPVPAAPPVAPAFPDALAVRPLPQAGGILLPYPATTGLAVLRRGREVLALFDSGEALDLTAVRGDVVFAALQVDRLGDATLLRLPLAAPGRIRARREPGGWMLEAHRPAGGRDLPGRAMAVEAEGGVASRLVVRAGEPGRVVPVIDPETGLPLLVGTVRESGQMMPVVRRLPELDLPPTFLGGAVLARADQVTMRATAGGFLIGAAAVPLSLDPALAELPAGSAVTRSFDLPRLPAAQLLDRTRILQASIATAAPCQWLSLRRAAAETLLALGLPPEAQAMVDVSRGEDPEAVRDAHLTALAGAAAPLGGRLPQAAALRQAELTETDELGLWRALLLAAEGDAGGAAPAIAAALPLVFDYAETLRAGAPLGSPGAGGGRSVAAVAAAAGAGGSLGRSGAAARHAGRNPWGRRCGARRI